MAVVLFRNTIYRVVRTNAEGVFIRYKSHNGLPVTADTPMLRHLEYGSPSLVVDPTEEQLQDARGWAKYHKLVDMMSRMPPFSAPLHGYSLVAVSIKDSGRVILKCLDPGCGCEGKCHHTLRGPESWLDLFEAVPDERGEIRKDEQWYALVGAIEANARPQQELPIDEVRSLQPWSQTS